MRRGAAPTFGAPAVATVPTTWAGPPRHGRHMITTRRAVAVLVALALAGCAAPTSPDPGPLAATDVGTLRGVTDGDVVRFRGVPYARPPVGDLRFAPPEPVAPWAGERAATVSGPPCAQRGGDPAATSTAEDCLRLDVTAPASPGQGRPVLVWLHGGGLVSGAGSTSDPRRMAVRGDAVVVTVEFRLGVFGFLGLPGLPEGTTTGLADQQEALRFVRRNAAAFGGDPENVTLFGQSGGGIGTCAQLTSPGARDLVDRAIVMSGGPCAVPQPPGILGPGTPGGAVWSPVAEIEAQGLAAAARLGCPDPATALECLRALPVERLLDEHGTFGVAGFGGTLLPEDPSTVLDDIAVPVLSGHTRDESNTIVATAALLGNPVDALDYPALIEQGFGSDAAAVLAAYPRGDEPVSQAWARVYTDRHFVCPQLVANDAMSRSRPVHAYEFADRSAPPLVPLLPGLPPSGAAHGTELAYLFDPPPVDITGAPVPLTGDQLTLGEEMIDVWTGFARTGAVPGPLWSATERRALVFGGDAPTTDPWAGHRCDFWAPYMAR